MKKYVIKYEIILTDGKISDKEIKVSNCESSIGAQVKLENYLKNKYKNFKQLLVTSCEEDSMSNIFGNDFLKDRNFNDIFKEMGL